jgi:putative phosphoribosyl transferase
VVLALPRGGAPVAAEVAAALDASWDVFIARKVGAPGHREYGIGAVAEGGVVVVDHDALAMLELSRAQFDALAADEQAELERRVALYRGGRPLPELVGHDVVLVDDGLARGVTAEAALRALQLRRPRRLVLAVPTGSAHTVDRLRRLADDVVCVITPGRFSSVGEWYDDFGQTSDDEVIALLGRPAPRAEH